MRNYEETRLQIASVDYLRGQRWHGKHCYPTTKPFPDLLFTATAFEGRSAAEGYKRKRMGVRAGVWDVVCWWPGTPGKGILEAKAGTGLSSTQKEFQEEFHRTGGLSGIFHTVAEMRDIIISWGLKCSNMTVEEPGARKEVLYKAAIEMFRP